MSASPKFLLIVLLFPLSLAWADPTEGDVEGTVPLSTEVRVVPPSPNRPVNRAPAPTDARRMELMRALLNFYGLTGQLDHQDSLPNWEKGNCTETGLSFKPYVSSYLPLKAGPLTRKRGRVLPVSEQTTEEQINLYASTSLMQRLDILNGIYLGKRTNLQSEVDASHYKPSAEHWEGFCNGWAAASSNKFVNDFIDQTGDLNCSGVIITKGEVKELMTGFLSDKNKRGFAGNFRKNEMTDDEKSFFKATGIDLLKASDFDRIVSENLKNDRGVVISAHPGPQVWNHPVYKSKRCEQSLDDSNLGNLSKNRPKLKIPPRYLVSKNPSVSRFLAQIEKSDKVAYKDGAESAQKVMKEALKTLSSSSDIDDETRKQLLASMTKEKYSDLRDQVGEVMQNWSEKKTVSLNPDFTFEIVSNQLTYRTEGSFAENQPTGPRDVEKMFTQIQVKPKSKDEVVDSFWVTHPDSRPPFIWVPPDINKIEDPTGILNDFVKVVEKCKQDSSFNRNNGDAIRQVLGSATPTQ